MFVALLTAYRQPELRFWFVATVVFALLCLGPVIVFNGQATLIKGPFTIFQSLPFFKGNRYPSRYSVMLLLSLSVTTAFGLVQIGRWAGKLHGSTGVVKRYLPLFLITALFFFEHLSLPLPQSDMRTPAPYHLIAATPGEFPVLDIPFAWRNGFRITGALTTQFMFGQFYQASHQKRLLQGNTSRNPAFKFQYFTNAPVINSLLALETGKTISSEQWETDRTIAAEVLRFFNIKYIVVRADQTGNSVVTPQATIPYIEDIFPAKKIHDEAAIKIYRVNLPIEESRFQSGLLINTEAPLASLYFGEGWGLLTPDQPLAAQRKVVRLLIPFTGETRRLTLRMRLPEGMQPGTQTVFLETNGWQSPPQTMGQEWQAYTFDLPADLIRSGLNDLYLHFAEVISLPEPHRISTSNPEVTVLSAGQEVGDFGHIYVNGYEVSPNQRGYNIAIIQLANPSGESIRTANFDTHCHPASDPDCRPYASAKLVEFVDTAPPNALIAISAADEASANLSEEAVLALQAIGATGDLRGCFRCSHAIISAAGQPDRKAIEALDPLRPVGLTTGLGLTEPNVAALVDWIRVEASEK
jgi:hypothetical protein